MSKKVKKSGPSSLRQDLMLALLLLMCVPFITLGYIVYRLDLPTYRGVIENTLTEKTGRNIKLAGDISWTLTPDHGVSLAVTNISIGNPSWASRPRMAQVGEAKLHVEFWPLFQKKLNIVALNLTGVDMQLESGSGGHTNWTFTKLTNNKKNATTAPKDASVDVPPVTVNIKRVSIKDSRFGFMDKKGNVKIFTVPELTLLVGAQTTRLNYKGTFSGVRAEMTLVGGRFDQINAKKWPFNAQIFLDNLRFDGQGYLKNNISQIVLNQYLLSSDRSKIKGQLTATLGGKRPHIRGTAKSSALTPSDFAIEFAQTKEATTDPIKAHERATNKKSSLFSNERIDFSALKAVDLSFDIIFDKLAIGMTAVSNFMSKVHLRDGILVLSSTKGQVAGSTARAALKLDTSVNIPKFSFVLKANDIDMSHFVKMGGLESIIHGKSNVDILLKTNGRSSHEFASFANGHINILMDTGTISQSALRSMAGSLVDLFAPGVNMLMDTGVNCMAARYKLTQGLLETDGLLIDTVATTISGTGYANLADERINMDLVTKPKALGLGSMIPSMQVRGSLKNPNFKLDTENTFSKVTGLISGKQLDNGVPNILKISGKNACAATLDNPKAARAQRVEKPVLIPGAGGGSQIKNTVNQLLQKFGKGLF